MASREHHRVQLRLPVRLRWTAPLGQKIELAETIDVSRGGLLVSTKERHAPGVPVWVTFPYDSSLGDGQPEIPARVVRSVEVFAVTRAANARDNVLSESASQQERSAKLDQPVRALGICEAPATLAVAIHFEEQIRPACNGNKQDNQSERRSCARRALAVPVRVRLEQIPWFEEAMTIDFSAEGMRFHSQREYRPGDYLILAFNAAGLTPWLGGHEFPSIVVRVHPVPASNALDVGVRRRE